MKKLVVADGLLDINKTIDAWKYCAPVFIANSFFGTFLTKVEDLAPEKIDKSSVRSGTLTFISYKGEYFALTCNHVLEALVKRQKAWKAAECEKYGDEPPMEGFELFTPKEQSQHHFNYKLVPVPLDGFGEQPDIAIARINCNYIKKLGREAIVFSKKNKLPETGIASGYPEEQRVIRNGKNLSTFSPKYVACLATLQVTAKGGVLLQDSIIEHNDIDVLSGMSGGPIIWSDDKKFGLAGIIVEGLDVQPKEGQLVDEPGIWIHGERITTELFDVWVKSIPPLNELKNKTQTLSVPESMKIDT
jgi:hypothetical protein